ncbi:MAG: hypothetical protein GY761_06875 [Hyphomicrobiales bacterium]|nr:hypothetical protein [Hyphomicrobiales bacterium]
MTDTIIPQLRRKFRLLIEHGHYKNLEGIAGALGKTQSAIETWADGNVRWETGRISKAGYSDMLELFRSAISKHHDVADIEAAVKGRVSDLEELFKPPPAISLSRLLKQEAVTDRGRIWFPSEGPIDLVTASNAPRSSPDGSVHQGKEFWLEFTGAGPGAYTLALQNHQQSWGFVSTELQSKSRKIFVPGFEDDGSVATMHEDDWTKINRFMVFQSPVPFPREILNAIKEGLPADKFVQPLAEYYSALPFEKRKLFMMHVLIKPKADHPD